ncbi:MAG: hypothetical protein K2K84_05195 [Muribaculaceae bacterium]|nr:hypothetical protein [Muribaculaceae bacterium]
MNQLHHTDIRSAFLAVLLVCSGCTRVPRAESASDSLAVADGEETYVSATPEGVPVTVLTPAGETFDGFIDSLGTVFPAGVVFDGDVSNLHHGLFVMGPKGNVNIYSPLRMGAPLNADPFSSLTDFRMGVAYGTRPGRDLMVVGHNGIVSRILSQRVRSITLHAPGSETVSVSTTDLPLDARLTADSEDFFMAADTALTSDTGEHSFWPSLELVSVGDGFYRVFRRDDGRAVGDFLIKPLTSADRFKTVTTSHINPAEADSFVKGITSTGWEIDSTFYSASTPGWLIADKTGMNPLDVFLRFNYLNEPVITLPRVKDEPAIYFTFTAPPYIQTNDSGLLSWFALPRRNKASRLRAVTMPVTVDSDLSRQMMKAAESLVMQRGFIGLADRSHGFHGKGDTYLYFVPNDRGFFIVMSFGQLDYTTLMGTAITQHANNKNNHINISL